MNGEEKKFIDLDHVCDQILDQDDREMFNEAIRCYYIGSHRAAVILAWSVTADCLERRIGELSSDGDGTAQVAVSLLTPQKGMASFEELLITQAKKCELFDDYEEKCLRFARDIRSKCAHPTGVNPSAETVRNILYICSQTTLCREGYRGMTFIKTLMNAKLSDKHFISDPNRISETCSYYFSKVPKSLWPQFAAVSIDAYKNNKTQIWKDNAIHFIFELLNAAEDSVADKIARKLPAYEAEDRDLFSIFVGLDGRVNRFWDEPTRTTAKSHLLDSLKVGKPDRIVFNSWANLCSIDGLSQSDKELLGEKINIFSGLIAQHSMILDKRREEILVILLDTLRDSAKKTIALRACKDLFSSSLCLDGCPKIDELIKEIVSSDWLDADVQEVLQNIGKWSVALLVSFINMTDDILIDLTVDRPDDMLTLFEAADALLKTSPTLLPTVFEDICIKYASKVTVIEWNREDCETWRNFIGQLDVLKTRYSQHLPKLAAYSLPVLP